VLARELHVRNIDDLEKAIHSGRLNKLPGIKAKTIENITKGIELVRAGLERLALSQAQAIAEEFVRDLERVPQVERVVCAGSLRRQKPTVRDIDILVLAIDAQPVMDAFVSLPCAYTTQAWAKQSHPCGLPRACRLTAGLLKKILWRSPYVFYWFKRIQCPSQGPRPENAL